MSIFLFFNFYFFFLLLSLLERLLYGLSQLFHKFNATLSVSINATSMLQAIPSLVYVKWIKIQCFIHTFRWSQTLCQQRYWYELRFHFHWEASWASDYNGRGNTSWIVKMGHSFVDSKHHVGSPSSTEIISTVDKYLKWLDNLRIEIGWLIFAIFHPYNNPK